MKTDLRLTDTNAASDSKGRTWGLEGGLFWWLVGGIGAGITLFFVLLVMVKSSLADLLCRRARAGRSLSGLHLRAAAGKSRPVTTANVSSSGFHRQRVRPQVETAALFATHSRRTTMIPLKPIIGKPSARSLLGELSAAEAGVARKLGPARRRRDGPRAHAKGACAHSGGSLSLYERNRTGPDRSATRRKTWTKCRAQPTDEGSQTESPARPGIIHRI